MVYGDYPPVMRKNVGSRLPSFTDEEAKRVKGSFDFVGFNHYVAIYVKADLSRLDEKVRDYMADAAVAYDSKNLRAFTFSDYASEYNRPSSFCSAVSQVKEPVPVHVGVGGRFYDVHPLGSQENAEASPSEIQEPCSDDP